MRRENGSHERLEVVAGILLGIATVASTWCAYQATLWSGEQTRTLADASVKQFESLRRTMTANRESIVDVMTFASFIQAEARKDSGEATYIRKHARPEFRPALEAWIAEPTRKGTPFGLPQYHVAEEEAALEIQQAAAKQIEAANLANDTADIFVLHTVVLAMALFLLGAATQVRGNRVQQGMLAFGALVLLLTLVSMVRRPRAPRPHPHETAGAVF
jgi:hypothetical protein